MLLSRVAPILPTPALRAPHLRSVRSRRRIVRAAEESEEPIVVQLPEGVSQPKKIPEIPAPWFGFVDNAERINSRVAMIGFVGILIVEFLANKGILQIAGVSVGTGLGFEI